jgi:hypothetical protein
MRQPPDRRRGGPEVTTPQSRPTVESPSSITDTASVTDADGIRPEPAPLGEVIGGLLEHSDSMDGQLRLRLAAYREGWQSGHEAGFAEGRQDMADELAAAWNRIAGPISRIDPQFMRKRWSVRGELRTREQFGQQSPGDFKGRGAA